MKYVLVNRLHDFLGLHEAALGKHLVDLLTASGFVELCVFGQRLPVSHIVRRLQAGFLVGRLGDGGLSLLRGDFLGRQADNQLDAILNRRLGNPCSREDQDAGAFLDQVA